MASFSRLPRISEIDLVAKRLLADGRLYRLSCLMTAGVNLNISTIRIMKRDQLDLFRTGATFTRTVIARTSLSTPSKPKRISYSRLEQGTKEC